jgi:NitT/TauT family transport system substrate-binding protein
MEEAMVARYLAGISVALLGFCVSANAQEKIKVRSAFNPSITWSASWVAKEKGFFDQQGLDVSFITVQNIGPLPTIVGKQLDIAPATVVDMIKAVSGGLNVVAVAGGHIDTTEDAPNSIMAGKNSGIKTIKDLAGKTIGSPSAGSILHIALLHWLKREGVDVSGIRTVEVPFPNMGDQLTAGRIDVAESVQPFVDRMKSAGHLSLGDQLLQVSSPARSTVWVADATWAKANPEAIKKWTASIKLAIDYIKANPEAAREVVAKYTKLPLSVVETMSFPHFETKVQPQELDVWIKVLDELGQLQKKVDAASMIATIP